MKSRSMPNHSSLINLVNTILDRIDIRNLPEINIESWIRLNSLRYLLARSKNTKIKYRGREVDFNKFKKIILEEICFESYRCDNPKLKELFMLANKILDEIKRGLVEEGYSTIDLLAETKSKLIVGVSEEMFGRAIFEIGLMWNPYLNLPYIPGSSLKGAFRSYLTLKGVKISELEVSDLLGSNLHASYVVFVDSYPVGCRSENMYLLVPEVTTPIYNEHEGKIQETRVQPVPVIYPVVNEGVRFRIIVGIKVRGKQMSEENSKKLKLELLNFLNEVLKQGIGAKTMLGYGILSPV